MKSATRKKRLTSTRQGGAEKWKRFKITYQGRNEKKKRVRTKTTQCRLGKKYRLLHGGDGPFRRKEYTEENQALGNNEASGNRWPEPLTRFAWNSRGRTRLDSPPRGKSLVRKREKAKPEEFPDKLGLSPAE